MKYYIVTLKYMFIKDSIDVTVSQRICSKNHLAAIDEVAEQVGIIEILYNRDDFTLTDINCKEDIT